MKKKRIVNVVALLVAIVNSYSTTLETTANFNVYYPDYSKIDLVCGQMPKTNQKDVEFCCEAAFTGELLSEFKHAILLITTSVMV